MQATESKLIFMMVVIIASLSAVMIATPVMAQNMTGGNTTAGANMTDTNQTGSLSQVAPEQTDP
jgi:hypothetical protein